MRITARKYGESTFNESYRFRGGWEYVLCGAECYVGACLRRWIPTGASRDPVVSAAFIEA